MALTKLSKINWEKLLAAADGADMKRSVALLRSKATEISTAAGKYGKQPEPIDFAGYKQKLRFTSSAVDSLQSAYESRKLPSYFASVPDFEAKKRDMMMATAKKIVEAAQADLADLKQQVSAFETQRISATTTATDICNRFPEIGKSVESEIKNHQWSK